MEIGLSEGLQAILPRVVLYTLFGTVVAWVFHLIQPALVATFSSEYRSFSWISEKRGVGPFLKSTWDVAVRSKEIFGEIHRRVRWLPVVNH